MSKKFMENALWVLKSVYYMKDPKKITKEIKKGRMSTKELAEVMFFLDKKGLINIKEKEDEPFHVNLTDRGIEFVANELSRKRQEVFNKTVAFTGATIALIGIYTFIRDNFSFENYPLSFVIIKIVFLFLLFLCIGPLAKLIINFWEESLFKR